jgi:hypothetical protein
MRRRAASGWPYVGRGVASMPMGPLRCRESIVDGDGQRLHGVAPPELTRGLPMRAFTAPSSKRSSGQVGQLCTSRRWQVDPRSTVPALHEKTRLIQKSLIHAPLVPDRDARVCRATRQ